MVTARDIMSTAVQCLERGTNMADAARLMVDHHVGSVIVTTNGYPVGIVTETDITRLAANGNDLRVTPVESVMSSPLFSTDPETDIVQVANTMSSERIKKMPVVERQRVIGVLTQTDIVKHVLAALTDLRANLTAGSITASEFDRRAKDLFATARLSGASDTKQWHMLCTSCGLRFLDQEHENALEHQSCPNCGGPIIYDPTPPM